MRYASVTEAAHVLAVSKMTIRQWCFQGRLKYIKIGDFLHVDLWNFLIDHGANPKPIFDSLNEQRLKRVGIHAKKTRRAEKIA